ncbi:type II CRISPR RNA-guided endonuclease Cas9 [Jeotgalibaca sp. PTS2502]|uniref:type II CRISPR RNA-guided endonuclease Cas9 n=1 Tax=Jeotgalibaca sp. PTS2502 TaxID=1903686 RepID=UPI000973515F|nr:type II CRISPR RNA-guided endonuclease Cas9 [Jeotgalibaca sp. PTS2502]APZ49472.1 type II CRISPR RNA-guided endonuclease Cas9 [Jeotgalibaca sp. PTS2502]
MSRLVLGLDIGISSVGWGVIDIDEGEIKGAGVRLFEEATRNANEERRSFRGARRLKRRRKHRLERLKDLLSEHGLPIDQIGAIDPYLARRDALYQEVSADELASALYHLAKRRGTTLDIAEDESSEGKSELSTKKQLSQNAELLKEKYVVELQLERLDTPDGVRNHRNRFKTSDYIKEAKAILTKQQEFHSIITDEFIADYIALVESRRMYYDGPGSKKSPTPYGQYWIGEDGLLKYETMINKMRGRCTYLPDELRIAKMSYTADLFNLLNDLNNLQYPNPETGEMDRLTLEDKDYLIETFIKKGKNLTLKIIAKRLKVDNEEEILGSRVDMKTGKPIFTEFKGYKKLMNLLKEVTLPEDFFNNKDVLDEIAEILTAEKSLSRREEQLIDLFHTTYGDELANVTAALLNDTSFKEYHSLSKKAIEKVLPELWETNKNQMQLFTEKGYGKSRLEQLQSGTKIQFDDEAILSVVAKRAHREAIKVTNAVREQFGELDYIVVEMAREKNSDEQKKRYSDAQKQQGKFEKKICDLLGVESFRELHLDGKKHLGLKLWDAQDGKCLYSGKTISLSDVVYDFHKFEIDHIIPLSYSFDDSQQNKVLVYRDENQNKGQLTPFQYFNSGKASRSFEEYRADCLNLFKSRRLGGKKLEYLLEMRDVQHDEEVQKDFINRNLVDTQYAMRSFSQSLRTFYMNHDISTRVLSIRGSFTAALRRRTKLNKDRDEGYAHHAIDALIVAAIGKMPLFEQMKHISFNSEGIAVDTDTGEILEQGELFENKSLRFISNLRNYESQIKYSHKVDRKPNRTMTNQTLYSTREKEGEKYVVGKVKNIYELDKKGYEGLKKKIDKDETQFLMAQHDPTTWALIKKVMEEHKHADNPFQDFYAEHGYIKKDGKVPVKGLKYLDNKLGIHVPITHKFADAKNDVVLLKRKSIRVDIYMNKKGKYKYLGIPYNWFRPSGNKLILNMSEYNSEHGKNAPYKQIDDNYTFQFSLYKNDVIKYDKLETVVDPLTGDKKKELVSYEKIFRGDNDPKANKIEVKDISFNDSDQQKISIGTLINLKKYTTDSLGNYFLITNEVLKKSL